MLDYARERIEKYFKGHLVIVYTDELQIPLTSKAFHQSFVGYVDEVGEHDLILRHMDEDDRISMIPLCAVTCISQVVDLQKLSYQTEDSDIVPPTHHEDKPSSKDHVADKDEG